MYDLVYLPDSNIAILSYVLAFRGESNLAHIELNLYTASFRFTESKQLRSLCSILKIRELPPPSFSFSIPTLLDTKDESTHLQGRLACSVDKSHLFEQAFVEAKLVSVPHVLL